MDNQLIKALAEGLQQPLPGVKAQYQMAHVVRRQPTPPPADVRRAAVLALFYPSQGDWNLVFIERPLYPGIDRHGGQISFPGGKVEPTDASLQHTALREAEEEIGLAANTVKVLGTLTELYIPVSNFLVHPYVGQVDYQPHFLPDEREVSSIIEVPYAKLQDAAIRQEIDLQLAPNMTLRKVPYFNVEGKVLWGATAMIVSELLAVTERTFNQ